MGVEGSNPFCSTSFVLVGGHECALVEKIQNLLDEGESTSVLDVTWVTIEEVSSGEWGIGGKAMTTEAVKALASGKAAA